MCNRVTLAIIDLSKKKYEHGLIDLSRFLYEENFKICYNIINLKNKCIRFNNIKYGFIKSFYYDIGLDLKIYYEFFDISQTEKSKELYDMFGIYTSVFISKNFI